MKILLAGLAIMLLPSLAAAQERRFAAGVSGSYMAPTEGAIGSRLSVGPFVQMVPKDGFGPAFGFTWFEDRFDLDLIGGPAAEGKLTIRPVMAGVSYTVAGEKLALSVSFVGGYAFNKLRVDDGSRRGPGDASIENSAAYRPGVSLWQSVHPRVALKFFGGYVITRPTVALDVAGTSVERRLKADYAVASAGVAFVLF